MMSSSKLFLMGSLDITLSFFSLQALVNDANLINSSFQS